MKTPFDNVLRRVRVQCGLNVALEYLALALCAAAGVVLLAAGVHKVFAVGTFHFLLIPAVVVLAAAAAAVLWWRRRMGALEAAVLVDQRLGLREKVSTSLALAESDDPFAKAACRQAREQAAGLDVKGKFPVRLSRQWYFTAGAWVAAVAVVCFVPQMDLLGHGAKVAEKTDQQKQLEAAQVEVKKIEEKLKVTVNPLGDKELTAELANLDKAAELAKPEEIRRESIKTLGDLAEKVQTPETVKQSQAMANLKDSLKGLKGSPKGLTNELNKNIAKGDFKKAAEALRQIEKEIKDGKLPPEQAKQLENQLQDLANQMEKLAAKQQGLEDELEKSGLPADMAKLDAQQLKDALAKQGLSQEKIDQLMQKAASQKLTAEQLEKLAKAMKNRKSGDPSKQPDGQDPSGKDPSGKSSEPIDLGELADRLAQGADQLDMLEAMKQDAELREMTVQEIKDAIAKLGKNQGGESGKLAKLLGKAGQDGQGPDGQGAAMPGGKPGNGDGNGEGQGDGQGNGDGGTSAFQQGDPSGKPGIGSGGPGQGYGKRPTSPGGDTALSKTKVESAGKDGPAVASWYYKGEQVKGESKRELAEILQAAKDSASDAVTDNEIPRKYEGPVKKYFSNLEENGK